MTQRLIIKLSVFTIVALAFLIASSNSHSVKAAHVNDNFSAATPISAPLPYKDAHEATLATVEVGEPSPCASIFRTVWYSYTPSSAVTLAAHTARNLSDAVLGVYTGGSLATLATVGCDAGNAAEVVFNASAGVTYYFQVGAGLGGLADYVFSLHEPPAKGNDDFAEAVAVSSPLPFSNTSDTRLATLEASEPQPCASITHTIWYSYTPSSDGILAAEVEGAAPNETTDTALAVYTGAALATLTNVDCDNNAGIGAGSRLAFAAAGGVTYYFQVGTAFGDRGNVVFRLSSELPPVKGNDNFANAVQISEPLPYVNTQDTKGALMEPGEPTACAGPPFGVPFSTIVSSVWYSFTPTTDVFLNVQSSGTFAATHRVYRGSDLASLTPIGCGSPFERSLTSFVAGAGVTYHFQVGGCASSGCNGSAGDLTFELSSTPCPPEGCIEMALNIPAGDCDDSQIPTECDVPTGSSFALSVDIVKAPPDGYVLAQTYVDFGSDLTYKPTASAIDEFVWPDCDTAVRAQFDGSLPWPRNTDSKVNHGCLTGQVPPLPVSHYVGPFVRFLLTCSEDVSSTEVKLLRNTNPVASTSGAGFRIGGVPATQVIPLVNHLTVNCVAPVAVGGVAVNSGLEPLAQLNADQSSTGKLTLDGLTVMLIGTALVVGALGWLLRRRLLG